MSTGTYIGWAVSAALGAYLGKKVNPFAGWREFAFMFCCGSAATAAQPMYVPVLMPPPHAVRCRGTRERPPACRRAAPGR
jgi:predicted MFS family arabinose efflux permease